MNKEDIKELRTRVDNIFESLDIPRREMEIKEDEERMQDPKVWDDNESANKIMKRLKDNKYIVNKHGGFIGDLELLELYLDDNQEEAEEFYKVLVEAVKEMEYERTLSEEDHMDSVLTIVAGAGGTEAQDYASMLARMYTMYFKKMGWDATVEHFQDGDSVGYKTITYKVEGRDVYRHLKSETGVHRLVRVSPFNAQGKRMTSFASVFVAPLVDDTFEVEIDEARISYDYFRCSGAGGQNVNKVNSGVRARYQYVDPYTGEEEEILVENTETRDQPKNKENARRILKSILYEKELRHRQEEKDKVEASKKKIEWGSQIRSYVFDDKRVKDHRTNYQTTDVQSVMDGNIEGFVNAYLLEFCAH